MKPQQKEAVSVQEIMNSPIEAGQKALYVRREGVLGWLSYIGYMCMVALTAWVCLIFWYFGYFYCKAKDGYRYVWLKVALFTVLPFVPLLLGIKEIIEILRSGSNRVPPLMGTLVMD